MFFSSSLSSDLFLSSGLEDGERTDAEEKKSESEKTESEEEEDEDKEEFDDDLQPIETPYVENRTEELGQQGEACQTEEVADENKSLIWTLVKQVGYIMCKVYRYKEQESNTDASQTGRLYHV